MGLPLHLLTKPTGALNAMTTSDRYPLPLIQDCVSFLHGKTIFSTIDPVRAYNQIPVAPEDIPKTAISISFGLFDFLRMSFGLRNAAQTFQRFIDTVLHGLDFACAYINDLLIASSSLEEHYQHLKMAFRCLDEYGVVINPAKCQFAGPPNHSRGYPPINEQNRINKEFLGMVNFYRRFIPDCATIALPLISISSGKNIKRTHSRTNETFAQLKRLLIQRTFIAHLRRGAELHLMVDIGGTLH